jgi:hypothetical protein
MALDVLRKIALAREAGEGYTRRNLETWQSAYTQALRGASLARLGRRAEAAPLLQASYRTMTDRQQSIPVENRTVVDEAKAWIAELRQ